MPKITTPYRITVKGNGASEDFLVSFHTDWIDLTDEPEQIHRSNTRHVTTCLIRTAAYPIEHYVGVAIKTPGDLYDDKLAEALSFKRAVCQAAIHHGLTDKETRQVVKEFRLALWEARIEAAAFGRGEAVLSRLTPPPSPLAWSVLRPGEGRGEVSPAAPALVAVAS